MDNNVDQWTTFLKGLGLAVDLEVVRDVATRVTQREPLYPLYASPASIAGKSTVYKIKRLVEAGKLDPLLCNWGLRQKAETDDPLQLAHLKALKAFLQHGNILAPFTVKSPNEAMEPMLKQLVEGGIRVIPVGRLRTWEDLPIAKRIRDHCPQHKLWQHIDEFDRSESGYWWTMDRIATKLVAEFHDGLRFPASEIVSPALEQRLLLDIFNWLIGQLLGNVSYFYSMQSTWTQQEKGGKPILRLFWADTYYAEGTEEQIQHIEVVVQDMIKRWSDSDEIRSLVHQYQSLEILVQKIRQEIKSIDEVTLAKGRCADCPIARSKQG
jgi:hypothetical protein